MAEGRDDLPEELFSMKPGVESWSATGDVSKRNCEEKELQGLPDDLKGNRGDCSNGISPKANEVPNVKKRHEEKERMARVNAAWEAMNSGLPSKAPKTLTCKPALTANKTTKKTTPDWMVALGLAPKSTSGSRNLQQKDSDDIADHEEVKRLAAAALSAVNVSVAASLGKGKVEIREVRDFAGEEIEVKKLVDVDSKEAAVKANITSGPPSALDSILEQIKKKQKLSVLDKTKKDWGEFKENKGLEEELDAYKKSSNQYLDKVSFLHRTDLREFERERDARLAVQAKRRPDMREDDL